MVIINLEQGEEGKQLITVRCLLVAATTSARSARFTLHDKSRDSSVALTCI
jgi:hypothetical protein